MKKTKTKKRKPRCEHPTGWWQKSDGLFYCEYCKRPMTKADKRSVAEFEERVKGMR